MPLLRLPRRLCVALLTLYQATLSPDHGPLKGLFPYGFCRHEPTCSAYGKRVIMERGVLVGTVLTIKRLLSCHPWTRPSEQKMRRLAERQLRQA